MENVEDILQRSIFGTGSGPLLKIHQNPIIRPKGGTVYLCSSVTHVCDDGYNWTKVSKQVKLTLLIHVIIYFGTILRLKSGKSN
jgi:hypothetical protein